MSAVVVLVDVLLVESVEDESDELSSGGGPGGGPPAPPGPPGPPDRRRRLALGESGLKHVLQFVRLVRGQRPVRHFVGDEIVDLRLHLVLEGRVPLD